MRTRLVSIVACSLVAVLGHGAARADKPRNSIALEVYTGERPPEAERLIRPILEELQRHDYDSGGSLAMRFEGQVSRPALTPAGLPSNFEAQVDQAFSGYKFREPNANSTIVEAVEAARKNPGAFVDAAKQGVMLKALIVLALNQRQAGDQAASKEAYRELARSFPSASVLRSTYGQDAGKEFDEAKREVQAAAHKTLAVNVGAQGGAVYVNENYRDNGTSVSVSLAPGEYRVFVKSSSGLLSRSHRVSITSEQPDPLVIDAKFDSVVRTSNAWTGLAFANAADREANEGAYARQFANAYGAPGVAVVGIGLVNGKPMVIGALINTITGADIRRGSVEMNASSEGLRNLAKFIHGGGEQEGVMVLDAKKAAPVVDDGTTKIVAGPHGPVGGGDESGGAWTGWKWVAGGAAFGGLATGGILLVLNGRCSQQVSGSLPCPDVYNYAVPGYLTLGAGAALAAVTVYLFVRSGDRGPSHTAFVAPAPGGAVAGFATSF